MTAIQRLIRVYTDSTKLGLNSREACGGLIRLTGEKPGKGWLKRVRAFAEAGKCLPPMAP